MLKYSKRLSEQLQNGMDSQTQHVTALDEGMSDFM